MEAQRPSDLRIWVRGGEAAVHPSVASERSVEVGSEHGGRSIGTAVGSGWMSGCKFLRCRGRRPHFPRVSAAQGTRGNQ